MKKNFSLLLVLLMATAVWADDDSKLTHLEARVQKLESKLIDMERVLGPLLVQEKAKARIVKVRKQQRTKARERMRQEARVYTHDEMKEIERLYKEAGRNWKTPQGKAYLKQLVEQYGKANRSGCALLYLGQMSQGEEAEGYFRQAIKDYGDCYYGNGVQVGPYARFQLVHYYKKNNKPAEAKKLRAEIFDQFPDAINHKGRLLVDLMGR